LLTPARNLYLGFGRVLSAGAHWENYRFKKQWPADKLALPPARLIYLVTGQYRIEPFLENGALGSECIRGVLSKNGLDIETFQSILDFGCGCGRVMRHWSNLPHSRLYGTDYNPSLIEWCREGLPFAQFSVNQLEGRLSYNDGQFDFLYAISVLTHLNVAEQQAWMRELWRVLRPGGHFYVTVHGLMRSEMTPKEQESFEAGNPVVFADRYAGSNICVSFCPEPFMRKVLAKDFTVVDYVPVGARDAGQDVYLLQRPHA
jgi:SAM-dependent methyltransferase